MARWTDLPPAHPTRWFWNDTAAGAATFALRQAYLTSADKRLKVMAGLFLVPGVQVPRAG
jgi:hypothetical protein